MAGTQRLTFPFILICGLLVALFLFLNHAVQSGALDGFLQGSTTTHQPAKTALTSEVVVDPRLEVFEVDWYPPSSVTFRGACDSIIVEDDVYVISALAGVLTARGCPPKAIYADCSGYMAGPIKNARVITVDGESTFQSKVTDGALGPSCVPTMLMQVPTPLVVGYTLNQSLHNRFRNNGASAVFDKYSVNPTQLVEELIKLLP